MHFTVLTLFPEMFDSFKKASMIGRAIIENRMQIETVNFREFAENKHKQVDDSPFGGGAGMVIQAQPLTTCIEQLELKEGTRVIYMTPKGKVFDQAMAIDLAHSEHLVFVCGHYEGIDQRFIDAHVTDEISIGDYVLTGGELPTMVVIDAVARMLDGVLGKQVSYEEESHYNSLLEYPHYTRPAEYNGETVPEVLLSGNHAKIADWRWEESLRITGERRPDLLLKYDYSQLTRKKRQLVEKYIKKYCYNK